jgi:seryl-tRNA synthetase
MATTKDNRQIQEEIQKAISLRVEIQKRIQQLQREKLQVPVYGQDTVSQQIDKLTSDLGKLDSAIANLQKEHADLIGQYFVNLSELQSGIKGTKNVVISDVKDGVLNVYNPFII